MKHLFAVLVAFMSLNTYALTFENVTGEYEVTYSKKSLFFGKEGSFKLTFKEIEGKYGEVIYESEATGLCTSEMYPEREYGYTVFDTSLGSNYTPLKLKNPVRVLANFFCPEWHQLVIEVSAGELENLVKGESTDIGFYLRNQKFKVILESKGRIQRLQ